VTEDRDQEVQEVAVKAIKEIKIGEENAQNQGVFKKIIHYKYFF
jgi:hypothetical protein